MTANELSKKFLVWFQEEYPDAKIYRNNRGIAKEGKRFVRYGIPTPTGKGKKEKLKGSDFISFHTNEIHVPGDNVLDSSINPKFGFYFKNCICKFWEIKTASDVIAEGQKNFLNMMTRMGAECYIVYEYKDNTDPLVLYKNRIYIGVDFYLEKWSVK